MFCQYCQNGIPPLGLIFGNSICADYLHIIQTWMDIFYFFILSMLAIPVSFSLGGLYKLAKNINLHCTRGIYNNALNRGFPFVVNIN